MAVATYCFYEKIRRMMRTTIASYLLKPFLIYLLFDSGVFSTETLSLYGDYRDYDDVTSYGD